MREHHIVAIYPSMDDAQRARDALIRGGFDDKAIRIGSETGSSELANAPAQSREAHGGFLSWLFGTDVPRQERDWYGTQLSGGRTALSVQIDDEAKRAQAEDILDAAGALELETDEEDETALADTAVTKADAPATKADTPMAAAGMGQSEEVIPLINEELSVGKRPVESRRRLRVHVVERPVEAQVNLKDETVILERRPASQTAAEPGGLQDREVEIIERTEEPVVEKRAEAEELVVRKDVKERTETVRDKLRESKVDVEKDRGISPQPPSR